MKRLFATAALFFITAAARGGDVVVAKPFDLQDVKLLDGPFKRAAEIDTKYLLSLEPDRLLGWFRKEAGLPPKAEVYGGWESMGVAGHSLGHYLSACSLMYRSTGDKRLLDRVNYIVDELEACQNANGNGYVAAIPNGKRIFAEITRGDIRTNDGLNGQWVPWYTIHKEMAGLRDAYLCCDNAKAKAVLIKLCDWTQGVTEHLTDAQMATMLQVEHGGMVETLADAYAITKDEKYLVLSRRFTHHHVLDPLAAKKDKLAGLHANTQIPKFIGSARRYELSGEAFDHDAADFFWQSVVHHHTYVNGGHSEFEQFFPSDQLAKHLGPQTTETCNTYNMLKLTSHLFSWAPSADYADFYERALYNHILASQDPQTGMFTYFVSFEPGHFKTLSNPISAFWCCVGTGMENHATYGRFIYSHDDRALWVNLFIPSDLNWSDRGVVVRQETKFPEEDHTRLTIQKAAADEMPLHIRCPAWCPGMTIKVNDEPQAVSGSPGSYVNLIRTWKPGDVIDIHLPMQLHTEATPDDAKKVAIMYGPIVLAGKFGTKDMTDKIPFADDQLIYLKMPPVAVPSLSPGDKPVSEWLTPVEGKPLVFKTTLSGAENIEVAPLYEIFRERYTVYWDVK